MYEKNIISFQLVGMWEFTADMPRGIILIQTDLNKQTSATVKLNQYIV